MKNLKNSIALLFLLFSGRVIAQEWIEGKDLSYLQGERELLLKFSYENLRVGATPERKYLEEKREEYNKESPGKGDRWAKEWEGNKVRNYEPKFEELFNKMTGRNMLTNRFRSSAKYSMIIHITNMESDRDAGMTKKKASIDFEISIVETANPSLIRSKCTMYNVPGTQYMGDLFDFERAFHSMRESFARCGKDLGKELDKTLKH